jgi:Tol biopolymer transport system component
VVWSPTRDLLLFTRERNLWSVRTDGTDLARLTSCEETEGPNPCAPQTVAWSPDGNQIAYIHGDPTRLTIMGADGSDARDLELPADHSFYLDGWQPVARSSSVESPTPEASPTAGPLARESIVFTREEPEGGGWRCDLFTTEPDGTEKRPLTVTPSTCETGPAVAPGGSAVAVSLDLNDIAVIDLVTSTVHRLTDDPATLDSNPAWSPDGSQIAFSLGPEMGPNHIYVMNADGTDVRQLTDGSDSDRNPAWSPDGTRIAFARSGEVYVMDTDGSNVTAVTALAAESAPSPAWSPDGSQIALDVDGAIYVMTVNGTGLRRLSPELPKGVLDQHPSWSPDGTQIAFSRYTNEDVAASAEDGDIWIIDADGTDATRVTRGPAIDSWPQWVYGSAG